MQRGRDGCAWRKEESSLRNGEGCLRRGILCLCCSALPQGSLAAGAARSRGGAPAGLVRVKKGLRGGRGRREEAGLLG